MHAYIHTTFVLVHNHSIVNSLLHNSNIMILGNRHKRKSWDSWELCEKYSYAAVEIGNISQVYAVFG